MRFRIATAADLAPLRALVEKAYRGETAKRGWTHEADLLDDERTSDAELAGAIGDSARRVILAIAGDTLVGTVTIANLPQDRAYLGMLCVDPDRQAEGLGRALIAEAESVAVQNWAAKAMEMTVIDARRDLIAWYERRGYRPTGETRPFPNGGEHAFAMTVLEKPLGLG